MIVSIATLSITTFQLTHSRGVRQQQMLLHRCTGGISTHALTWSATLTNNTYFGLNIISTHALTWSATVY